jgi:hypothetical protein
MVGKPYQEFCPDSTTFLGFVERYGVGKFAKMRETGNIAPPSRVQGHPPDACRP